MNAATELNISDANSEANSTETPLAAGATFTGSGDLNAQPDVAVACKTDQDGTLYVYFSIDGMNWDTQIPFSVAADRGEFHSLVKGPRYCRVRFTNNSVDPQTYLRLSTMYGTFRQPNSGLHTVVQQDADAATIRGIDPYLAMKQGLFEGYILDTKFGRNADIDDAEDIWNGGGNYTGQPVSSLETIDVLSSDANDTSDGTGARTVRLYGLDEDFNQIEEDVTLSGTTPVTTVNTWRRMNRMKVLTAGSGEGNAGTLTARHTTTTANVFAVMPAGNNQTAIACYTVPAGYTAYLKRFHVSGARLNSTVVADFAIRIREPGSVYQAKRLYTAGNGQSVNITYVGGMEVPEMSDIKVRCESISATNGDFAAEFAYVLVRNF